MDTNNVRKATPADADCIFALWLQMIEEHSKPDVNAAKVRAIIDRYSAEQGGILGVIGQPGDLKACICLTLDQIWFNDQYQLSILFDFVRPDSRSNKARHANHGFKRKLLNYAKHAADILELELMTGVFTNELATDNIEGKLRIYTKLLPKAGEFFRYKPSRLAA